MEVEGEAASTLETSRNGYTFGKRYNTPRSVRVLEVQGLQVRVWLAGLHHTGDRDPLPHSCAHAV